ncbi:hypothetical protein P3T43_007092 [Paraburkholderia sp. GAS41]|jgi:hypothetical protein|uniref:hypothetical protein n=1 Tax=Paraburkholderia sp. GAS41 TaxID=3035134 RepID=UPI003D19A802
MFITFRPESSSSAASVAHRQIIPTTKRWRRENLGAYFVTTVTTNAKAAHGSSGSDVQATTAISEDVGAQPADAGIPKLAGDDIEAHYGY